MGWLFRRVEACTVTVNGDGDSSTLREAQGAWHRRRGIAEIGKPGCRDLWPASLSLHLFVQRAFRQSLESFLTSNRLPTASKEAMRYSLLRGVLFGLLVRSSA